MESVRGKLLISSVRLGDPNFARAVVLMLAHDENGALGLVLNRPIEAVIEKATVREAQVFQGGPCEVRRVTLAVFDDAAGFGKGLDLGAGIRWSSDAEEIEGLLQSADGHAKFFLGYSGWSAGQLESELEEEAWLILPARHEHVFGSIERLWALTRTELMSGGKANPPTMSDDPSMN
jgi:putative transcriptional regulator